MKILLVEPFFGGSHSKWADGYVKSSRHDIRIISLSDHHWKWRMHGGAVTLAKQFLELDFLPDVILATDMLDLSTFLSVAGPKAAKALKVVYFHENQITYPWSPADRDLQENRDNHYGFINYVSALVADKVFFNSEYHLSSFLGALPGFLNQFPDHRNLKTVAEIEAKSAVLHLGMDLKGLSGEGDLSATKPPRAVILWNHRWEYDKNPEGFFNALFQIQDRGWDFNLIVMGEKFSNSPKIFSEARDRLKDHILHWGFVDSREDYLKWMHVSDILPVTSHQDFFGGSVVEAMYCDVKPLLPKRLAYPEHVPEALHHTFFYDEGELVDKLQRWISHVSILRRQQVKSFVQHYDWSVQAPIYDDKMKLKC